MCLDGETLAALGAATSEHLTAALGGHTSTEAVGLGALALVRLIRTLHSYSSRLGVNVGFSANKLKDCKGQSGKVSNLHAKASRAREIKEAKRRVSRLFAAYSSLFIK